mgnify:FL=1
MSAFDIQIGGTHYSKYKIQLTEFLIANEIQHGEASVFKYMLRHKDKDGIKDVLKAIHYIAMIVEKVYPDEKEIQEGLYTILKEKGMVAVEQSDSSGSSGQERDMQVCDLRPTKTVERDSSWASG